MFQFLFLIVWTLRLCLWIIHQIVIFASPIMRVPPDTKIWDHYWWIVPDPPHSWNFHRLKRTITHLAHTSFTLTYYLCIHLFVLVLASTYSYASLNSNRHNKEGNGTVKSAKNWVNPASAFRALTHLSEMLMLFVHQISDPIFTISQFREIKIKWVLRHVFFFFY